MPDVYTDEWYDAVRDAMNASAAKLADLPEGAFVVAIEIFADGCSPYVEEGRERRFLARIEGGRCAWYRELDSAEDERAEAGGRVDYRFRGPASSFDELAAGLADPIDAALRGTIKVRGDIRFLLRHADHVKALLDAYTSSVATTWPEGRPPYGGAREGGARASEEAAAPEATAGA
ncbi:MAG: SCP2 sterol-binding domain-containing protein [Actinomycetota bacterium]|jgi:putative sterol carrier protein|nr:SCP2 sterol-binding domain-containing protein [Actinomycetota bacterium]